MVWWDCSTQLRAGDMGIIGLDYAEARQAARDLDIPWTRGIKRKIQVMERELLKNASTSQGDES